MEIITTEIDQKDFEELGLSTDDYEERVIACLKACKRFSIEALELGLVEEAVAKVSNLPKAASNFDDEIRLYRGIPQYRDKEPSLELRMELR